MISVVIPALNEERLLPATLESVRGEADEVLVIDGGSSDRTREIAVDAGARVLGTDVAGCPVAAARLREDSG